MKVVKAGEDYWSVVYEGCKNPIPLFEAKKGRM
jgi:hypothetical protein